MVQVRAPSKLHQIIECDTTDNENTPTKKPTVAKRQRQSNASTQYDPMRRADSVFSVTTHKRFSRGNILAHNSLLNRLLHYLGMSEHPTATAHHESSSVLDAMTMDGTPKHRA